MKQKQQLSRQADADNRYDIHRTLQAYTPATPPGSPDTTNQPVAPQVADIAKPKSKRLTWKKALLALLLMLISVVTVFTVWNYRNISPATQKLFGESNVFKALLPAGLQSTNGKTNVLVIGYSADDPGHAGALLTDSIMVISVDKSDNKGYTLSIPRDLYVKIPNYGSAKINEAYQAGERAGFEESGFEPGGAGLLQKVVRDTLGITTHYVVVVNYGAVRDITDSLEGITVTIESPDSRGLYDPNFKPEEGGPLQLTNGPQTIDGQTALRLTRARGSTAGSYGFPQSDFNRTLNQQKVFSAIKAKLTPSLLIDPRKNKPIFTALGNNLQTSLDINEVLPLYRTLSAISDTNMRSIGLHDVEGVNYLRNYRTPTGQSALVPRAGIADFSEISALLETL